MRTQTECVYIYIHIYLYRYMDRYTSISMHVCRYSSYAGMHMHASIYTYIHMYISVVCAHAHAGSVEHTGLHRMRFERPICLLLADELRMTTSTSGSWSTAASTSTS